jgi:hypothetical protein
VIGRIGKRRTARTARIFRTRTAAIGSLAASSFWDSNGCDQAMNRYNVATAGVRPDRRGRLSWLQGLSMDKWLCWASLGVAAIVFIFFLLDMLLDGAFRKISLTIDILSLTCCALLGYLAWDALRDIR